MCVRKICVRVYANECKREYGRVQVCVKKARVSVCVHVCTRVFNMYVSVCVIVSKCVCKCV